MSSRRTNKSESSSRASGSSLLPLFSSPCRLYPGSGGAWVSDSICRRPYRVNSSRRGRAISMAMAAPSGGGTATLVRGPETGVLTSEPPASTTNSKDLRLDLPFPMAPPPPPAPTKQTDEFEWDVTAPIRERTPPPGFRKMAASEKVRELYYTDRLASTIHASLGDVQTSDAEEASDLTVSPKKKPRQLKKSTHSEDPIRSYLYEIGQVELLDAGHELSLARDIKKLSSLEKISIDYKMKHGIEPPKHVWAERAGVDVRTFKRILRRGLRAKEHMVAANLRLVVSIAKKYCNRGLTFQDLIQEGSIGLIRGAEKFDPEKGFKFSTYATWWIRQAITRALADHSRPIRLPVHVNDTIASIKKVSRKLMLELNRRPTDEEIAEELGVTVEKIRFFAKSNRMILSIDTPVSPSDEGSATLGAFIEWDGMTPQESVEKSMMREDMENVLNTLTPRERDVVRMRYGFDDGRMKTLEEIGMIFCVTRERIRQIEAKALRKLRHPNRNAVLREYVYETEN